MGESRYMISETAKQVDVESHVLRYWEEELEIGISRTELGHRYYTEEDIRLFRKIKELKERGLQLKAIKVLVPELKKRDTKENETESPTSEREIEEKGVETLPALGPDPDKLKQFEHMMTDILKQVVQENNAELENRITDSMVREVNLLMQAREEREEERFRRLDETIRSYQKNRQMVAAAKEPEKKRRFCFWGK